MVIRAPAVVNGHLRFFGIGRYQPAAAVAFIDPAQAAAGRANLNLEFVRLVRRLEDRADVEAAVAGDELEPRTLTMFASAA